MESCENQNLLRSMKNAPLKVNRKLHLDIILGRARREFPTTKIVLSNACCLTSTASEENLLKPLNIRYKYFSGTSQLRNICEVPMTATTLTSQKQPTLAGIVFSSYGLQSKLFLILLLALITLLSLPASSSAQYTGENIALRNEKSYAKELKQLHE